MNQSSHLMSIKEEYLDYALGHNQVQCSLPVIANQSTLTKVIKEECEEYVDNSPCDKKMQCLLPDIPNQSTSTKSQETFHNDHESIKFECDVIDGYIFESPIIKEDNAFCRESDSLTVEKQPRSLYFEPEISEVDTESHSQLGVADISNECEASTSDSDDDRLRTVCHLCGSLVSGSVDSELSDRCDCAAKEKKKKKMKKKKREPEFWCGECGRVFKNARLLADHGRSGVHAGLRPYRCDECGSAYTRRVALTVHRLARHEGGSRAPYRCRACVHTFNRPRELLGHMWAYHRRSPRPFGCEECPARYVRAESLRNHVDKMHPAAIRTACLRSTTLQ